MERPARAFPQFRLPVVHQVVDEIEPEPKIVLALHPAGIRVDRVGLVVAEQGIPALVIPQGGIAGDVQGRHAAFARVGAVGPRNPEDVQSEVGAEIRGRHVLAEPRPAERPVNQERRRDGVGLAHARDLHERVTLAEAAAAQAWTTSIAEAELATDQRIHRAVLEPELMPLVAVPIDLGVDVVAVQRLRGSVEIVVRVTIQIRERHERQHLQHGAVQASLRDGVDLPAAGKHRTTGTIRLPEKGSKIIPSLRRCYPPRSWES